MGQTRRYALVKARKTAHCGVSFTVRKEKVNHLTMTYLRDHTPNTGIPPLTALGFTALHRYQAFKNIEALCIIR